MKRLTFRAASALLLSLTVLMFAACGGVGGYGSGGGGSAPAGTITTINITPATATIAVNGTQQYAAVGKDSNGNTVNGASFTWMSSNPGVATVNSSGMATAVAAGTTMITASITYSGGIYGMGVTYTSNAATLTVSANGMAVGQVAVSSAPTQNSMGTMTGMPMSGMNMMPITHTVQGATVSLKDSGGQTAVAMSDGNGRFQIATSGLRAGFLLKAEDNQGHTLFSFADSAGNINVTPLTDLMVRMWYGAHGTTADAAFANPAAHPVPQAAQLAVLNQAVVGLLATALSSQGLAPAKFDLIATPINTDGTGFGRVLDNVSVLPANGQLLLRDALGGHQTVMAFDVAHHSVTFSTLALNGGTLLSNTSLTLP